MYSILFSYFNKVPAGKLSHLKLRPQLKPPLAKFQISKQLKRLMKLMSEVYSEEAPY